MKKIVLLLNASRFKASDLDFAAYISRLGKSKLIGLFVEENNFDPAPAIHTIGGSILIEEITRTAEDDAAYKSRVHKNTMLFDEAAVREGVNATSRHYRGNAIDYVLCESRNADMIILDPAFTLTADYNIPTSFVTHLLSDAECPVIVAPEHFMPVSEVIIAYDGSKSCLFAVKQFYHHLPEMADKHVQILHVNKDRQNQPENDQQKLFTEWVGLHFSNVQYLDITGNPREELYKYLMGQNGENTKMLVTGSWGRSMLSMLLRRSSVDLVLKSVDIPVFVAHS